MDAGIEVEVKNMDETKVLFPEVKIGKFTIKPFSFGQLIDLTPSFERIAERLISFGIRTVDLDITNNIPLLLKIYLASSEEFIDIIYHAVNPRDENGNIKEIHPRKEIYNLTPKEGFQLIFAIWNVNKDLLMDFFGAGLKEENQKPKEEKKKKKK